jgi:hypothetical protein
MDVLDLVIGMAIDLDEKGFNCKIIEGATPMIDVYTKGTHRDLKYMRSSGWRGTMIFYKEYIRWQSDPNRFNEGQDFEYADPAFPKNLYKAMKNAME